MSLKKEIPNLLTLSNLLAGCLGLVFVMQNNLLAASYCIGISLICDFFDGFLARLLSAYSEIGKQLDSLADMVTFGVLPSMIIFQYLERTNDSIEIEGMLVSFIAFLLAVFSALRLAKFNIDTRQADSFIGVPTPANAILVASLPFILRTYPESQALIINPTVLIGYTFIMSFFMVMEVPLLAFKFKNFGWKENQIKYIFFGLSVVLLILLKFAAVPLIVGIYILLSFIAPKSPKGA